MTRLAGFLPGGEKGAGAGRADKRDAPHVGKSRAQSRLRGWTYRLLGSAMIVTGIAGCHSVFKYLEGHASSKLWLGVGFFICAANIIVSAVLVQGGISVSLRGRRHLAPIIAPTPDAADRDLVLYLRSFDSDAALSSTARLAYSLVPLRTEEEQLADAVRAIGRMVAVGRPGETLPHAGAERAYLPDGTWQETVLHLLGTARLVLLGIGRGAGLTWELAQAVRLVPPERLVLLIPAGRDGYGDFCVMCQAYFPCGLPQYSSGKPLAEAEHTRLKAAVYFEPGWVPRFVRFDMVRTRGYGQVECAFAHQLKPVYERLGAPWPGIDRGKSRSGFTTKRQSHEMVRALIMMVIAGVILSLTMTVLFT